MNNENIIASIIVCTFNGKKRIANCLNSLINQKYPKRNYEIIVVDDGSTDNTSDLVSEFSNVKLIRHKRNKGLAAGRNTGLRYAKGQIYVCFDDDCIADKNWLKNLLNVYKSKEKVLGVAGVITPNLNESINERFIRELGYGSPQPIGTGASKNPARRFLSYLKNYSNLFREDKRKVIEVSEISGANSSFFVTDLKNIKGWNNQFTLAQDTEICLNLRKTYPLRKFYMVRKAKLIHDHRLTFNKFSTNIFKKSNKVLKFYKDNKIIPPIFPFPIFFLLLLISAFLLNFYLGLVSIIFIPQVLYFWWPIKYLKKLEYVYLFFPYMQLILELSSVLGLIISILKDLSKNHEAKQK